MAKEFTYRQSFEADPATVFAMLLDPEYVQVKCAATGSLETTVEVNATPDGAVTITSTRVLPADVPAPAKKFVGETISATETQEWSAASPDGSRTADVSVDFSGPLSFSGSLSLAPGYRRFLRRNAGNIQGVRSLCRRHYRIGRSGADREIPEGGGTRCG